MFERILDLILPQRCVGCATKGTILCGICANDLTVATPHPDPHLIGAFSFQDKRVKKIIHALKYRGATAITPALAEVFYANIFEELTSRTVLDGYPQGHFFYLVPVPLTKKRERWRGISKGLI